MTIGEEDNSTEQESEKPTSPQLASVELNTWGTHVGGGKGIAHFMDTALFGANCGHAALTVSFPADENGIALVDKYCVKDGAKLIPFHRHAKTVRDPETGKPMTQDFFTVHFSWWPSMDKDSHSLFSDINIDRYKEREGVDLGPLNPRFQTQYGKDIETRAARGKLGQKYVTLAPRTIVHATALDQKQQDILDSYTQAHALSEDLESLKILKEKLVKQKSIIPTKGTLGNLLNRFVVNWTQLVDDPKNLKPEEVAVLSEQVANLIKSINIEKEQVKQEQVGRLEAYTEEHYQKMVDEANEIKQTIEKLNPATEEAINAVFSHYPQTSILTYKAMKAKREQKEISGILAFIQPDGSEKPTLETIKKAMYHDEYPDGLSADAQQGFKHWRLYLPEDLLNLPEDQLTPEKLISLSKAFLAEKQRLAGEEKKVRADFANFHDFTDPFMAMQFESALTIGLNSDNTEFLPVRSIRKSDPVTHSGMNIECMLEKMHALATVGGKFNLYENNCSSTTGSILAAGAEPELRPYFEEKAAGFYGTPQVVLNGAIRYHDNIIYLQGKIPLIEKINRYNPLYIIPDYTGKMVHTLMHPNVGIVKGTALAVSVVALGVLSGACETIKAIGNPRKTVEKCRKFISYAWSNPSGFLKVCSVPVAALATVFAAPAAVQTGFSRLLTAVKPKPTTAEETSALRSPSPMKKKTILIEDRDPKSALNRFHQALETKHRSIIPVFETKTQKAVSKYINQLDKSKPVDKAVIEQYERDATMVFERAKLRRPFSQTSARAQSLLEVDAQNKFNRQINYNQQMIRKTQKKYNVQFEEKKASPSVHSQRLSGSDQEITTMAVKADCKGQTFESELMVGRSADVVNYDVSNNLLNALSDTSSDVSPEQRQAALNVLKSDLMLALTSSQDNMIITIGKKYVDKGANAVFIRETLAENPDMLNIVHAKNLTIKLTQNGTPISVNALIDNIQQDQRIGPRR